MAQKETSDYLKVALLGMDARTSKILSYFLEGPCKNAKLELVEPELAELDIIDADVAGGQSILDSQPLSNYPRALLILSLKDIDIQHLPSTIQFAKKPLNSKLILNHIELIRNGLKQQPATHPVTSSTTANTVNTDISTSPAAIPKVIPETPELPIDPLAIFAKIDAVRASLMGENDYVVPGFDQPLKAVNETVLETPTDTSERFGEMADLLAELKSALKEAGADELSNKPEPQIVHYVANLSEKDKSGKHQTALQMGEQAFTPYIKKVGFLNPKDPKSYRAASYDARQYLQGYVASAFKIALERKQAMQLTAQTLQLIVFPQTEEVWINLNDAQLLSIAHTKLDNKTKKNKGFALAPFNGSDFNEAQAAGLVSMDTFIWKLACWTSYGHYPEDLDINRPVYLKNWPNFTRLLITPHALRIAALLAREPLSAPEVAKALNIKLEYVFVFISAAFAVGLISQSRRNADTILAAKPLPTDSKRSIFGNIINKLRGR